MIDKEIFISRLRDLIATLRKEKFKGPEQSLSGFESGHNCGIDNAIGEIEDLIDEIPSWS